MKEKIIGIDELLKIYEDKFGEQFINDGRFFMTNIADVIIESLKTGVKIEKIEYVEGLLF